MAVEKSSFQGRRKLAYLRRSLVQAKRDTHVAEVTFSLLVDAVQDYAIFLLDENGIIQSWNSGAARIKGYSAKEIVGQHLSRFYPPEDGTNKANRALRIAAESGRFEEENWRIRKDGTRFWASVVISPIRNKLAETIGFIKVTRDLTKKKQTEELLRQSEERNRLILESLQDYAMFMISPSGIVTTWNAGAKKIKGYDASEILGKNFCIFYRDEDIKNGLCDLQLQQASQTGRVETEGWRQRKDGSLFWAHVVISALKDGSGELLGFSKVTRDITEKRQTEEKLKLTLETLEQRVEQRTQELSEANHRLKEAIQVRDEFLSIASHELRTPLTPLKLQVQGLMSHIRNRPHIALPQEGLMRIASTCDKAITRLASLVDNLLDVSRINSGRLRLNLESVELSSLLQDVAERHRLEAIASGSTLELNIPQSVQGNLDRLRVEQIITNLLTNAIKYGRSRPIQIHLGQEDQAVTIQIRDFGKGIPKEDQQRIFERFERVTSQEHVGGLGLGLFITRQIVHAHGGEISVESCEGQGSTFVVKLPLRAENPSTNEFTA